MSLALVKSSYTLKNVLLWGNCLEHLKKANEGQWGDRFVQKIGHGLIGAAELFPILGQIISIIEAVVVHIFNLLRQETKATSPKIESQKAKVEPQIAKVEPQRAKVEPQKAKIEPQKATPSSPVIVHFHPKNLAEATAHALKVVESGDAGIKSISSDDGIDWIIGSIKDPANPEFRQPNKDLQNAKKGKGEFVKILDSKTFFESNKTIVEFIPITPKVPCSSPPTDTKLTSLTLMGPGGDGVIFTRGGRDIEYATGLMWDASKLRHNKTCAYWSEDAYSSWRGWKLLANDIMLLAANLFENFKKNLLPSYSALKDYAKKNIRTHNELLAHISKEALVAVFIRSTATFNDSNLGLKHARFRAICEKIKIKKELGKELPILILNNKDRDGVGPNTQVYSVEQQKKDWEEIKRQYECEWGMDPNEVLDRQYGLHGLCRAEIDNYFANI